MVTPNYIRELLRYYKKKQTSLRVIISVEGSLLIKNILITVAREQFPFNPRFLGPLIYHALVFINP